MMILLKANLFFAAGHWPIERASQSRLNKIIGTPEYQQITIRNWKTTAKLKEMIEGFDFVGINR